MQRKHTKYGPKFAKTDFFSGLIVKCLHCDDEYKYEDSKVIQFPNEDEPYIVCKNYPKCDGSLIDMFSPDDEEDDDYGGGVPFDWDMDQGYVDEYE